MPTRVATIDLSAAIVGNSFNINIGQSTPPPTLAQQMNPIIAGHNSVLKIHNESGVGFSCHWPLNNQTFTLPAGQWPTLYPPPNEDVLIITAVYILPNAPIDTLFADLYLPGEQVYETGALGNSPVNGGSALTNNDRILDPNDGIGVLVQDTFAGGPVILQPTTNDRGIELNVVSAGGITTTVFNGFAPSLGDTVEVGSNTGNVRLRNDLDVVGPVTSVNSLATVGSFGVPAVLVHSIATVNVTTLQTTHSLATVAGGTFLVGGMFRTNNGTPPQLITFQVAYTQGFSNTAITDPFQGTSGGAYATINALSIGNGFIACQPLMIRVQPGTTISIQYRDAGGTPNDSIDAFIWQFA